MQHVQPVHASKLHTVTQIVRVNSNCNSVPDGYLAVYRDNKPVIRAENLVLLKRTYSTNRGGGVRQATFMFSLILGGDEEGYQIHDHQAS
jgi:hypothetical protein